ncbi:MFS transporter [Haloferax larsenii]|uniref:MFS transporter n=1 Tax=Haloferax larsenii TaxID=302484 RepID=A0ABY5RET6_HALLR|nr:MFS transporter [Haloferax larsenii]UVE50861.1 MFS transporter [Haloferax larsenii]
MNLTGDSRVISKYYLYKATTSPGFMFPVYTLLLLSRDLTFVQIGITGTATALAKILGEVPTGYIGDRVGRRNSLVISQLLFASVPAGLVFAERFPVFVAIFATLGLAETFQSGSGDAWLYDTLLEEADAESFTSVRGRAGALRKFVGSVTMVLGGVLYAVNQIYPFVAAACMSALGALVLVTLPPNRHLEGETLSPTSALSAARTQLLSIPLRSFVLFVGLLFAAIRATEEFIQPATAGAIEATVSSLTIAGQPLPDSAVLGVMYASFTLVSAVASDSAGSLSSRLGTKGVLALVSSAMVVSMLIPTLVPAVVIPTFFVLQASKSIMRPIANQYINDRTDSFGRATVLSAFSLLFGLLTVPFMLIGGVVADRTSAIVAVAGIGGVYLLSSLCSVVWESPVVGATEQSESGAASAATD